MTLSPDIQQALDAQADACALLGSAFSARVLRLIAAQAAAGGPFATLLSPWRDADLRRINDDVMPLRVLGGLHYLVLSGRSPALAAVYPPQAQDPDDASLSVALAEAAEAHAEVLTEFMGSPPQTNEVRRSLCLLGGFIEVAIGTDLPLRCLEIGSSAGLNLNWDRYRYELGGERGAWGDPSSPVRLDAAWSGAAPPLAPIDVVFRAGCDRQPIDLAAPDQALRLQAYVWPDQADRLQRLRAAIAVAAEHPPPVERMDAAVWATANAKPEPGAATVLFHSVVWQYLPPQTQAAVETAIQSAGRAATSEAPFAWLRMEPDPEAGYAPLQVALTQWPGGETRILADVHPHGAMVHWR